MRSGDYFFSRWKGRLIHSGIHILSHLRLLVRWEIKFKGDTHVYSK